MASATWLLLGIIGCWGLAVIEAQTPSIDPITSITLPEDQALGEVTNCTMNENSTALSIYASITGGNTRSRFQVSAQDCKIHLIRPLDYEQEETFTLTLVATEDESVDSPNQTLTVTVTDVNDNAPVCEDYVIVGNLPESSAVGATINTFNCTDPDTGGGGNFTFGIQSGDLANIDLDPNTGEATLKAMVDFDTATQTSFSIVAWVTDQGSPALTSTVTVYLNIYDSDDFPPVFTNSTSYLTANISENDPAGTSILQMVATDADPAGTVNSEVHFSLQSVLPTAAADWIIIDEKTGKIYAKQRMDREEVATITAVVKAYSGTNTANGTLQVITITINDVNDNIPTFPTVDNVTSATVFGAHVTENANVSDAVLDSSDAALVFAAIDLDGDNITYSTNSTNFNVDSSSGAITVAVSPDYETFSAELVEVVASDGTLSSTGTIQILIDPENEFDPSITSSSTFTTPESTVPGSVIGTIVATDNDLGLDGQPEYSIPATNSKFIVEQWTGKLRLAAKLDYETDTSHQFLLEVNDQSGTTKRTVSTTITVSVTNVVDEPISCDRVPTTVINDVTVTNALVANMSCTDPESATATFTYTIATDPATVTTFGMSGNVVQLQGLPTANQYTMTVTANETSSARTYDVVFVVLTETLLAINEVNDTVVENTAQDLNDVTWGSIFPYGKVSIDSGNTGRHVALYSTSGKMQLVGPYDYDSGITSYIYTVKATSTFGQEATANYTVWVTDENDNTPTFGQGLYTLTVQEDAALGVLTTYSATDSDSAANGIPTHQIIAGNTGGAFSISAAGQLSLVAALDYETLNSYTLVITAEDAAPTADQLTGTTTVVITVGRADVSPTTAVTFTPSVSTQTVVENSAIGATVVQVQATNTLSGVNYTYSIASGNTDNDFLIDPVTGIIYVRHLLDRERTSSYNLITRATDQYNVDKDLTLIVSIQDENDNDPQFSMDVYEFNVDHDALSGTSVGTLTATDADDGSTVNGQTDESIVTTSLPGSEFTLSSSIVRTAVTMNYVDTTKYTFKVLSVDRATPSRTGTSMVIVHVVPPTVTPFFNSTGESATISEDTKVGYQVIDLDATALGASETNGTMIYSIASITPSNHFNIRSDTGEVVVSASLDYETAKTYTLTIQACAVGACATKNDNLNLVIYITNENDNRPIFSQESYSFEIEETESIGNVVNTITATDNDVDTFNTISYTMSGSSAFTINSASGDISVSLALDYTVKNVYSLIVTGTDDGSPAKSSQVSVVIRIKDTNTNDPVYTSANTVSISDSTPINSEVFHFHATDVDTGTAGTLSYGIVSDDSGGTKFSLDSDTGILTTIGLLDASVSSSYTLEVRVVDGGTPVRSATATLSITVEASEPNNNSPVFTPSPATAPTLPRTSSVGTSVYTAIATDPDNGAAGTVTYKMISGNTGAYFLIDGGTAVITTATSVRLAQNSYTLLILAVDNGIPQKSTTLSLTVNLSPLVTISTTYDYTFSVSEDASILTSVGTINVDSPRTATAYAIPIGNNGGAFSVTSTGIIKTAATLDYEMFSEYALQVQVTTDVGDMYKYVKISVTDVNDNPPAFASSTLSLTIAEGLPTGLTIDTITFTDDDTLTTNQNNSLEIQAAGSALFNLDAAGNLVLNTVPDFETLPSLSFDIYAKENNSPFTTSTLTVSVTVIDIPEVEDKYPSDITTTALLSLELPHQSSDGYVIHTLEPGDCGLTPGTGATTEYLSFFNGGPFSVGSSSGEISVTNSRLLSQATKYIRWVVCKSTETSGTVTSRVVLMRIDTFDRNTEMVVFEMGMTLAELTFANIVLLRKKAQVLFTDTQRFGTAQRFESTTTARRRLLATSTAVYSYTVANTSADEIQNLDMAKTFLSESELLSVLQISADGTPRNGLDDDLLPVTTVEPYNESSDTEDDNTFMESASGIAVITVLSVFFVVLIATVAFCVHYQRQKNGQGLLHVQPAP